MKSFKETKIIGIDHGYGNMKTANHRFKTGISAYDSEPLFTADMLTFNGRYTLFLNMRIKDFPATIPTVPIFSVCSTILKWVRSVPSSATN